ncbi:MAG: two-component system, OmpR family, response regulator PrrA [Thermoleophilaceae bacterium]|jgi:DNA-binding response OmpR family regulator|nr:two-component system, OmpR family, response regulator PrrA [Thermoleophilaceae bacterium]
MTATSEVPLVLVVDDDRHIRQALERALTLEGFNVETAADGVEAVGAIAAAQPSVIVLDVTMPRMDGVEVARHLRADGNDVPVLMLSARDEVDDRVAGLQAGADDYVVKPFATEELLARLHALLRRSPGTSAVPIAIGELKVDPARRRVTLGEEDIELTNREFELLLAFVRHPGMVLTRSQLLEQVWGYTFEVQTNVVDVFVGYLRRKLEAGGHDRILHTVRGAGFVLRA